jgi:hypothetical protein
MTLGTDLETQEKQAAPQLQHWLLIAEPHLKQQEKAIKEQEKQKKKNPEAIDRDPREHITAARKRRTRHAPRGTSAPTAKANKRTRLTDSTTEPVCQPTAAIHATNSMSVSRETPKKLHQPALFGFAHRGPRRSASALRPPWHTQCLTATATETSFHFVKQFNDSKLFNSRCASLSKPARAKAKWWSCDAPSLQQLAFSCPVVNIQRLKLMGSLLFLSQQIIHWTEAPAVCLGADKARRQPQPKLLEALGGDKPKGRCRGSN